MLGRVQSPSNPSNIPNRIITEPSQYLEHLKSIITDKQKKLTDTASNMQKSVQQLPPQHLNICSTVALIV